MEGNEKKKKEEKSEPLVYKSTRGAMLQHDKLRSEEGRREEEEAEA